MENVINVLTNLLPSEYSIAIIFCVIALFCVKLYFHNDLLSMIIEKESIVKIRVVIITFALVLCVITSVNEKTIFTKYWLFLIIPFIYEGGLFVLKSHIIRSINKDRNEYCNNLCNQIHSRYDSSSGLFYIYPNSQTPKLWAASQTIYGLIGINNSQTTTDYKKFITYCNGQKNTIKDYIFKKNNTGHFKLISNLWTILALIKIITVIPKEDLEDKNYKMACTMITQGLSSILNLKLSNNGWAPSSDKEQPTDYRLHPTIISLWLLSEILLNTEKLNISETNKNKIINILNQSIYNIIENYNKKQGGWSNAPYEEAGKNIGNNSLSLYVFSILIIIKNNLHTIEFSNKENLSKFLIEKHNLMMKKVDNCLLRGVEDNETDGPYDNAVNFKSETLSVTFYDWLPMVILAINTSKLNGIYGKSDSFREKRLYTILNNHKDDMKNWYTYRLALMLIGFSINKDK
jgi:hypothetical protein